MDQICLSGYAQILLRLAQPLPFSICAYSLRYNLGHHGKHHLVVGWANIRPWDLLLFSMHQAEEMIVATVMTLKRVWHGGMGN